MVTVAFESAVRIALAVNLIQFHGEGVSRDFDGIGNHAGGDDNGERQDRQVLRGFAALGQGVDMGAGDLAAVFRPQVFGADGHALRQVVAIAPNTRRGIVFAVGFKQGAGEVVNGV